MMRRLFRYPEVSYAALMLVAVALIILVVCTACGSSAQSSNNNYSSHRSTPTTEDRPSDQIVSSVETVHVNGYTRKYVCFTYINHDMWCERVSVE